jgi:hypothetical protein
MQRCHRLAAVTVMRRPAACHAIPPFDIQTGVILVWSDQ